MFTKVTFAIVMTLIVVSVPSKARGYDDCVTLDIVEGRTKSGILNFPSCYRKQTLRFTVAKQGAGHLTVRENGSYIYTAPHNWSYNNQFDSATVSVTCNVDDNPCPGGAKLFFKIHYKPTHEPLPATMDSDVVGPSIATSYVCEDTTCSNCREDKPEANSVVNGACITSPKGTSSKGICDSAGKNAFFSEYDTTDCSGNPSTSVTVPTNKCLLVGAKSVTVYCGDAKPIPPPEDNDAIQAFTCTDTTCTNCSLIKQHPDAVVNGNCTSINGQAVLRLCEGGQITAETYQNEDCSGSPVAHYTMNSGKCYVQGSQSSIVFCPSRGAATSSPTPTKHHHEGPAPTPIPAPKDNEDFEAYTCNDTTCSNCTLVKKSPEAVVNGDCVSMNGKSAKRLCRDGKHITVDSFDTEDCSGSPVSHFSATAGKCLVGDDGQESSSIVFCPANTAKSPNPPTHTVTSPPHEEPSQSPIQPPINSESFVSYDCYDTTCTNCTLSKGPDIPIRNGECANPPGDGDSMLLVCDPKTHDIIAKGFNNVDCRGSPASEDSFKGNKCYVSGVNRSRIWFCPTTVPIHLPTSSSSAPSPPSPTRITPPENSNYFVVYNCHDSACTNCTLTSADVHVRNGECVGEDGEFTRLTCNPLDNEVTADVFNSDDCGGAPVSHNSFTASKCYMTSEKTSKIIFCPTNSDTSVVPNNTLPPPMSPPKAHEDIRTYICDDTTCTNCTLRKEDSVFDDNGCAQIGYSSSIKKVCTHEGGLVTALYTSSDCTGRPMNEFNYTSGKCNRQTHTSTIMFCPTKHTSQAPPTSSHNPGPAATHIPAPPGNKNVIIKECRDTRCSDCEDFFSAYNATVKGDCVLVAQLRSSFRVVCNAARTNVSVRVFENSDCSGKARDSVYFKSGQCQRGGAEGSDGSTIAFCPSPPPTAHPAATRIPAPVGNKHVVGYICQDTTCSDCSDMDKKLDPTATRNGDCMTSNGGSYRAVCNPAHTNITITTYVEGDCSGEVIRTDYVTPNRCEVEDGTMSGIMFCPDRTASELHPSPSSHSPHTRVPHTSTSAPSQPPPPSHSPKTAVPPVSIVGGDETATKQPASSQTSSAHPSATMKPHHSPSNHPTKARKDEPQTKKGDSHPLLIAFSVVVVLGVASIAAFLLVQKRTAATRRRMALVPMEEEEDYTTGDDDLDDLIGVPAEDKKNSKAPRRSPLNEEMAVGLDAGACAAACGGESPNGPVNVGDNEELENSI